MTVQNKKMMSQWTHAIEASAHAGLTILDSYIGHGGNMAVVFDIDDTLISSPRSAPGRPIMPIVSLYRYALANGFRVVIVTARPDVQGNTEYTLNQLKQHNIPHPHELYIRPVDDDPEEFKTRARNAIRKQGWNTILSIGDMKWDVGDFGGIGILVPPFPGV